MSNVSEMVDIHVCESYKMNIYTLPFQYLLLEHSEHVFTVAE